MSSTLQRLNIVYGMRAPFGDTSGDFPQQDVIDLLNMSNFAVNAQGWIPKLPQLKNGGVYLDTGIADGRELVHSAYDLVQETLNLTSAGATPITRYYAETRLSLMNDRALAFHTQSEGYHPVYLEWWAYGAPAPQYSLIYKIEIAYSKDALQPVNINEITLVIQRSPFWHALPPRTPPQAYTLERAGSELTAANANLGAYTGNLVEGQVYNRAEQNSGGTTITNNWIKIPKEVIPGDTPALVQLTFGARRNDEDYPESTDYHISSLYISKSTRIKDAGLRFTLNGGDGTAYVGSKVLTSGANGGMVSNGSASAYTWDYAIPASTPFPSNQPDWEMGFALSPQRYGRYAIFARLQYSGTPGSVSVRCRVAPQEYVSTDNIGMFGPPITTGENRLGLVDAALITELTYLGVVQLPFSGKDFMSHEGIHANVAAAPNSDPFVYVRLFFRNTAGSVRTVKLSDVVLMPIDEGAINLVYTLPGTFAVRLGAPGIVYDESGHLSAYGYPAAVSINRPDGALPSEIGAVTPFIKGDNISLTPGVDNYLLFLWTREVPNTQYESSPEFREPVAINIVPRWKGVRSTL